MDKFEKLKKGIVEYLHFEDLSSLECLAIMTAAKRRGLLVERVGCWTSRDKGYFTIHDYDRFCPDYLQDIEGWEFKAYEQIRITYEKTILRKAPTNLPLYELEIVKSWYSPERAKLTTEEVEMLKSDPTYSSREFEAYIAPIGVSLD